VAKIRGKAADVVPKKVHKRFRGCPTRDSARSFRRAACNRNTSSKYWFW